MSPRGQRPVSPREQPPAAPSPQGALPLPPTPAPPAPTLGCTPMYKLKPMVRENLFNPVPIESWSTVAIATRLPVQALTAHATLSLTLMQVFCTRSFHVTVSSLGLSCQRCPSISHSHCWACVGGVFQCVTHSLIGFSRGGRLSMSHTLITCPLLVISFQITQTLLLGLSWSRLPTSGYVCTARLSPTPAAPPANRGNPEPLSPRPARRKGSAPPSRDPSPPPKHSWAEGHPHAAERGLEQQVSR